MWGAMLLALPSKYGLAFEQRPSLTSRWAKSMLARKTCRFSGSPPKNGHARGDWREKEDEGAGVFERDFCRGGRDGGGTWQAEA